MFDVVHSQGLEVFDFLIVDAEAECLLKFRVPHAVQPHAVVVRCTLYVRGLKASVLQYLDCVFAFVFCHVHRSMITPLVVQLVDDETKD